MGGWKSKPYVPKGPAKLTPEVAATWLRREDPAASTVRDALARGDLELAAGLSDGHREPWAVLARAVLAYLDEHRFHAYWLSEAGLRLGEYAQPFRMIRQLALSSVPELARRKKPPLTACLIVRNEERTLPDCLRSVRAVADEIVVVDTGSTDATRKVAENAGAKIGTFEWRDDFGAARNAALEMATGEWVLSIDADERLEAAAHESVLAAMQDDRCVYLPLRKTPSGSATVCNPRLFPREGARWEGEIHETIALGAMQVPVCLPGFLLRHEAELSVSRSERNLRILQRLRERGGRDAELATLYEAMERYALAPASPQAALELEAASPVALRWPSLLSRRVLMLRAQNLIQQQRFDEAKLVAAEAEAAGMGGLWSAYLQARYAMLQGNTAEARRHAQRGVDLEEYEGAVAQMRAELRQILALR